MPTARCCFAIGVINGIIYVAGGYTSDDRKTSVVEAYDPATNSWSEEPPMINPPVEANVGAVIDGSFYSIGGGTGSAHLTTRIVESYSPSSNVWALSKRLPTPFSDGAAATADGSIYVVGGAFNSSTFIYHPIRNVWDEGAPIPTERNALSASYLGTSRLIYAIGGNGADDVLLNSVEAYNPATNAWSEEAPMLSSREGPTSAAYDGTLYAIGGYGGSGPTFLSSVEAYSPVANSWKLMAPMPTARGFLGAAEVNGVIYAIGGQSSNGFIGTVEAYTP